MSWTWEETTNCPIRGDAIAVGTGHYNLCCGQTSCLECVHKAVEADTSVLGAQNGVVFLPVGSGGKTLATKCFFCRAPIPRHGVEVEETLAAAALRGDCVALDVYGCLLLGRGDVDGSTYVRAAASRGCVRAVTSLGNHFLKKERYVDAFDCYRASAARGDPRALYVESVRV